MELHFNKTLHPVTLPEFVATRGDGVVVVSAQDFEALVDIAERGVEALNYIGAIRDADRHLPYRLASSGDLKGALEAQRAFDRKWGEMTSGVSERALTAAYRDWRLKRAVGPVGFWVIDLIRSAWWPVKIRMVWPVQSWVRSRVRAVRTFLGR